MKKKIMKKKIMKKKIDIKTLDILGCYRENVFNGTIKEISEKIKKIEDYVESKCFLKETIRIEHCRDFGGSSCEFEIFASRYETDEECTKRIKTAKKRKLTIKKKKEDKEKKEREEYERLKIKYKDE